jgi:hypothetical protein
VSFRPVAAAAVVKAVVRAVATALLAAGATSRVVAEGFVISAP